ncbi:hypothetical protein P5V15_012355 [Pogonomyrmex californicus]
MEFSLDWYYRLNRQVLSIYGLWPYQNATNAWIKRIISILLMIFIAICQIIKICMTDLTTDFILDCIPILIPNIAAILQSVNRIIINDKLRSLCDQIKIDWECARSQDEIKIMQTTAMNTQVITKLFLFISFIGICMHMLSTFLPQILDVFLPLNESRSREPPFHVEMFVDQQKHFYIVRFIMYFYVIFILGEIIANGTMFVVYMQHVSGMFIILGHRAKQSFSNGQLPKNRPNHGKDFESIAIFIEDHHNVLQFVDLIQSCYGLSLFVELLDAVILIGLTMVQIIKFTGTLDRSIRSLFYVVGQLAYIFMYSYMGQQLIDMNTHLFKQIYYTKWHNISIWKQKMMLFVMLKCMRIITINAYNIFILSLKSFSTIVHSAVSVCMLLRRI